MTTEVSEKSCSACGEIKPRSAFHRNNLFRDGLHSKCAACLNAYARKKQATRVARPETASRTEKMCGHCKVIKSLELFYPAKNAPNGRHGWCAECCRASMRAKRIRKRPLVPAGMKRCPACGEVKALDDFGRNAATSNGARSYCRPCDNADNRVRQREYVKTDRFRSLQSVRRKKEWKNGKSKARQFTLLAVHFGLLVKHPCEQCGSIKVQAHHEDYSKPLDVRWLCVAHHGEAHRKEAVRR